MELRFEGTEIRVRITPNKQTNFDMTVINDDGETLDTTSVPPNGVYLMLVHWHQEFAGGQ